MIKPTTRAIGSWAGAFAAVMVMLAAATGAARAETSGSAVTGGQLYRAYCLLCHGEDGRNAGPLASKLDLQPADLTTARYQEASEEELVQLVAGYKRSSEDATRMPNWGVVLREEELFDLAAYVLRLDERQMDLTLRGDTRRGRILYQRACASCHGRFGAGDGALAALLNVKMADFTKRSDMEKLSDDDILESIRDGSLKFMPGWRGVFSDHEIEDVAAYVRLLMR